MDFDEWKHLTEEKPNVEKIINQDKKTMAECKQFALTLKAIMSPKAFDMLRYQIINHVK
jgi:hypothetical protein